MIYISLFHSFPPLRRSGSSTSVQQGPGSPTLLSQLALMPQFSEEVTEYHAVLPQNYRYEDQALRIKLRRTNNFWFDAADTEDDFALRAADVMEEDGKIEVQQCTL